MSPTRLTWAVFILALGLRLLYFILSSDNPFLYTPRLDEAHYMEFGRRVASGELLGPARPFYQDPLYGYLVGLCFSLFGDNPTTIRILQIILDATTAALILRIGALLWDLRVGLIAGTVYAVYPVAAFYTLLLLKTTLATFLLVLFCYIWVRAIRNTTFRFWLYLGLLTAILVFTRSNFLLLAPLVVLLHWLVTRPPLNIALRQYGAYTVGVCLLLSVGLARNLYVAGEPILLTANAGEVFYASNNPENLSGIHVPPSFVPHNNLNEIRLHFKKEAERRLGKNLSHSESSYYWQNETLQFLVADPLSAMLLVKNKILRLVANYEEPTNHSYHLAISLTPLTILPLPGFGLLVATGAPGLFLALGRRRETLLLFGPVITIVTTMILFYVSSRLRFPLTPFLALGAGVSIDMILQKSQKRRFLKTGILSSIIVTIATVSYLQSPLQSIKDPEQLALAAAYLKTEQPREAGRVLDKLNNPEAHMAYLLALQGMQAIQEERLSDAELRLTQSLRYDSVNAETHMGLASLFLHTGRIEEAITKLHVVLQLRAGANAYCKLAEAYRRLEHHDQARHYNFMCLDLAVPGSIEEHQARSGLSEDNKQTGDGD